MKPNRAVTPIGVPSTSQAHEAVTEGTTKSRLLARCAALPDQREEEQRGAGAGHDGHVGEGEQRVRGQRDSERAHERSARCQHQERRSQLDATDKSSLRNGFIRYAWDLRGNESNHYSE